MELDEELRKIVAALNARGVRYALAGGLAVSIYAAPRATEDVDVLVAETDVDAAVSAVSALGFRLAGRPMDVARGRVRIQRLIKTDGSDLVPLDLLIPLDPETRDALDGRTVVDWHGEATSIVTVQGLRALKRLRGSAQDLADIEALGPEP